MKDKNNNQNCNGCKQEGKDVFEYSVFGSPNQKIGNFTGQKKLGDFSC